MYKFKLYSKDINGSEVIHHWDFAPVDREPGFDIARQDKLRATGAANPKTFWIKEVWTFTIGAGSLQFEAHREGLLRLLTADKIIWLRKHGKRIIETEFEVQLDRRVLLEYLQDRRSLKRKTFTIVEKEPTYYDAFEEFYSTYISIINSNALW